MEKRVNRIDEKLDQILATLHDVNLDHSTRLARLETSHKGIIAVGAAMLTALISTVVKIFTVQ